MNFITFSQLNADIVRNIAVLPGDLDLIVGVPRSGMLVANILSLYLNKPLCDIDSFIKGTFFTPGSTKKTSHWKNSLDEMKNILICEDSVCSGNSINMAKAKIQESGIQNKNIFYLAAYVYKINANLVDFYFREVDLPRAFEWNYLHIKLLENSCFDIDGVLCEDPEPWENDDGDNYRNFVQNAKPKFLPTQKISCIVTSRLEKYRRETEKWLKKHNIQYDFLYMLNLETAEQRQKYGCHAEFKARVYKQKKNAILFVESEPAQAEKICRMTGKAVFCPTNQQYYKESAFIKNLHGINQKIRPYIPKILIKLYHRLKR